MRYWYLDRVRGELLREGGYECCGFLADVDYVYNPAAVAAHHAAVVSDAELRDAVRELVDELRGYLAEDRVLTAYAVRADNVVARVHLRYNARELVRRVLEVRVERDYLVAARVLKAGHYRHVLAEVAVEVYDANLLALFVKIIEYSERRVSAAVVDKDYLKGPPHGFHNGVELREERAQRLLLVVRWDYDGDFRLHQRAPQTERTASTTSRASSSVMAGKSGSETILSDTYSASGRLPRSMPVISR